MICFRTANMGMLCSSTNSGFGSVALAGKPGPLVHLRHSKSSIRYRQSSNSAVSCVCLDAQRMHFCPRWPLDCTWSRESISSSTGILGLRPTFSYLATKVATEFMKEFAFLEIWLLTRIEKKKITSRIEWIGYHMFTIPYVVLRRIGISCPKGKNQTSTFRGQNAERTGRKGVEKSPAVETKTLICLVI